MHKLDLREMLHGWPTNLRYVNRYSTSRCVRPENVAEHVAFVVLYTAMITSWVLQNDRKPADAPHIDAVLMADALMKATVHDLEECRTGDIHRPFKYSHPDLKKAIDNAG